MLCMQAMDLHILSLVPVQVAASAAASACSNTLGYILSGTSLAQAIIAVRAAAANARVSTAAPPAEATWGCHVPYLLEAWPSSCASCGVRHAPSVLAMLGAAAAVPTACAVLWGGDRHVLILLLA